MKKRINKIITWVLVLSLIALTTPQTAQGYAPQKATKDNIFPGAALPLEQPPEEPPDDADTDVETDDSEESPEIVAVPVPEIEKSASGDNAIIEIAEEKKVQEIEINDEMIVVQAQPAMLEDISLSSYAEELIETSPLPDGLIPWDYSKGMWDWQERESPLNIGIRGVAYGNGVFVAVAEGDRLFTSHDTDASTWQVRNASNSATWRSVTFGNGMFVAVASEGSGNRIMTSTDGINWTGRNAPADNAWMSVTYGNGMFVAVAQSGGSASNRIMTSTDGVNWTARRAPNTNRWRSVTYGNGMFLAVSRDGDTNYNRVMTSVDGINWTAQNGGMLHSNGVTYGNGMFVASAGAYGVFTSPDGVNWTRNKIGNGNYQGVVFGEGLFVAVGQSGLGSERTMASFDGIEWFSVDTPLMTWDFIGYGNYTFVGVANVSGRTSAGIITSPHPLFVPYAGMEVSITKIDDKGKLLPGAKFAITCPENGVEETLPATDGTASLPIVGWYDGTYTITEIEAPYGYKKSEDEQSFKLEDGAVESESGSLEFTFINEPLELHIQKVDADTNEVLGLTMFSIQGFSKQGEEFSEEITAEDGTFILPLGILDEGTYVVTEIMPPEGYLDDSVPQEFEFISGELIINGEPANNMTFANHRIPEPEIINEIIEEIDEREEPNEPYVLEEPDEPYIQIRPDKPDIPQTGAEYVPGWLLPSAIMLCTGILIISLGVTGRKKGKANEKEMDN